MDARSYLSRLPLLSGLPDEVSDELHAAARLKTVEGGRALLREGDRPDHLFLVLSGRFDVQLSGRGSISEIGPGELVGEIGFFAREPRTASVVAIRDSAVLELDRAAFDAVAARHPALLQAVVAALSRRLADTTRWAAPRATSRRVRTAALVAAGGGPIPRPLIEALRRRFARTGGAVLLGLADVEAMIPGEALSSRAVAERLDALERDAELVLFLAEGREEWRAKAVRQADELLLVAAGDPRPPDAAEREALAQVPPARRRLVRLVPPDTSEMTGTAAWLEHREVARVHGLRADDDADVASLHRFLAGRAVGLVCGGGGGFGPAQIGIAAAFLEAGIGFDMFGGTSFGAATTTSLAFRADPATIVEGIDDIFVKARAFARRTLPRYALLDHTAFDRALQACYAGRRLEDAWRPVFTVAADLSDNRLAVIDRGPVWQAVRASASIPAVLPPFLSEDGRLLVDGAVLDNVPVAPMKALKQGPNLVIHFGLPARRRYEATYDEIPGRWRLAARLLTPAGRRSLPRLPGPISVVQNALTFRQPAATSLSESDLVLESPNFPGAGFLDFSRHRDVTDAGRVWAEAEIRRLREIGDPAFAALEAAAAW